MHTVRLPIAAVVAGLLLFVLGSPTAAQSSDPRDPGHGPLSLDLRGGYATASGDLGDVSDEGVVVGGGISYRVVGRLALHSELTVEKLRRGGRPHLLGGIRGPRTTIWHLLLGGELELSDERATPWSVWAMLAGGASYFDVTGPPDAGVSISSQTDWKPTLAGAVSLGYSFTRTVGVVGRSALYSMFGDRGKEGEFLGNERSIEISLGFRFSL